jgi:hypothetical protein
LPSCIRMTTEIAIPRTTYIMDKRTLTTAICLHLSVSNS